MTIRGLLRWTILSSVLALAACGGGSGRGGTDIVVTGTGPTSQVLGGQTAVFVMTVRNAGPNPASNVGITDLVGNQLALISITCSATGGGVCPSVTAVTMTVPTLDAGASLTFTVTTQLFDSAKGTISNSMSASVSEDLDHTNNQASVTASAYSPSSSLVVGGSAIPGTLAGGAEADFPMFVRNDGPDTATNVRIVDNAGTGLQFIGVTCTASGGAICPTPGLVMTLDTLPSGGRLDFIVATMIGASVNGTVANTMSVTSDADPNRADNSFVAVANVFTPRSGISVAGVGPSNVPGGSTATFQMTVSNPSGPQAADTIHLVNTVGSNLTQTSVTCAASGGAVCPASLGAVMDVTNLPLGGSLIFNIAATVAAGVQGTITNTLDATATTGGVQQRASAVAVGSAYSDNVGVAGVAPAGPLVGGASDAFTMTVSNAGPGTAQNVTIVNTLGAGLSPGAGPITCAASGGAVCPSAPASSMTLASLPASGSLAFRVPFTVDAGTNGTVSNSMTATAAGDVRANDNSATASVSVSSVDLGVSESGASQVATGSAAVFTAIVSNPGSSAVNSVTVTHTLSGVAGTSATITCAASSSATCPDTSAGSTFNVPTLPARSALTFTITTAPAATAGSIVSSTSVSAAGDPNTANNTAGPVTTIVADGRSGSYKVFAADGQVHEMAIDFDAGQYSMDGGASTSFVPGTGSSEFTVGQTSRFRVATDLIVGGHDFGAGNVPYVAARNLGSALSDLNGQYDFVTRDTDSTTHAVVTRPGVAVVPSDVSALFVCQPAVGAPRSVSQCTGGATSYSLSVSGNLYTATPITTGAVINFYLVRSGAAKLLVGAAASTDAFGNPIQRFLLGLQDLAALAGGALSGPSSSGDWVTLTLTSSSYSASGILGPSQSAVLSLIPNSGATSMLQGTLASDPNAAIYVMQAGPMAAAFGESSGTANGLLQLALP